MLILNNNGLAKLRQEGGYRGPSHMSRRFGYEQGKNYRERNIPLSSNKKLARSMTALPDVSKRSIII